jgi:hypothetical protein
MTSSFTVCRPPKRFNCGTSSNDRKWPTAVFRDVGVPVPHRNAKGDVSGCFLALVAHLIRVSQTQFQQGLAALRVVSCELAFLLTQR